ncbi:uncharacterized protein LOC132068202 isoform X2 [Lycium ferocissimum]|uniref:uncharacterized protein LOC132068202 isoform X2 n=1 Tax=Lycium ferocissimum TaxID=112874 RepID=UPI0028158F19|nr:uncharacterized protein LOC132068202 isoform X2 [Lycium ferocissimum]
MIIQKFLKNKEKNTWQLEKRKSMRILLITMITRRCGSHLILETSSVLNYCDADRKIHILTLLERLQNHILISIFSLIKPVPESGCFKEENKEIDKSFYEDLMEVLQAPARKYLFSRKETTSPSLTTCQIYKSRGIVSNFGWKNNDLARINS